MEYVFVRLEDLLRVRQLITCFTQAPGADYCAKTDCHDFWEFLYLKEGRMIYVQDGIENEMREGEAVFYAPNVPHSLRGNGEDPFSFFIVTFVCDSPAIRTLAGRHMKIPAQLKKLIDTIIAEKQSGFTDTIYPLIALDKAPIGSQQMLGLYLEQLLIGILRECEADSETVLYTTRDELDSKLAAEIRAYLEEHLYDAVDMKTLCEKFHYGKSRLSEIFRRAYGDSVMHWYLGKRIEAAGQAILCGEGSIAEISARLQFDSPQYFSRIFKKHMGISPREYRNVKR